MIEFYNKEIKIMDDFLIKARQLANQLGEFLSTIPDRIPRPSFLHSKIALNVLKSDLAFSGKIALAPALLIYHSIKPLVQIQTHRNHVRHEFSQGLTLADSLSNKTIGHIFRKTHESIKNGGNLTELDGVDRQFRENCDDEMKVKEFSRIITSIKRSCETIDREHVETKDKIDLIGGIVTGVLLLPALPLTLGLGALYSVMSVADSAFALATGKEFHLMSRSRKKPQTKIGPLDT